MNPKDEFYVSSYWVGSPEFLLSALRAQLGAAAAIWPELATVKIEKPRARAKSVAGVSGGNARAAALTPERRSEIASDAAKAHWGTEAGSVK